MSLRTMALMANRTSIIEPSAISVALRAGTGAGVIPLTVGAPAPELVPAEAIAEAFGVAIRDRCGPALRYGVPEGYLPLREFVAARATAQGTECTAADVLLTNGSQQALDLIGRMLLDPGSKVLLERPSYLGAIDAFRQYDTEFVAVGMDEEGILVDEVERELRADAPFRQIRFIYTMPNFHNPSGRTMSMARRVRLVELAQRYAVPIVEDDAYAELHFQPGRLPTLRSIDDTGVVLGLGSFSKVLAPGLRVGWVIAAQRFLAPLTGMKERSDLNSAFGAQMVALAVAEDGKLDAHLSTTVPRYRERRNAMLHALDRHFGDTITHTTPGGGFFIWLELGPSLDAHELLNEALRHRVIFLPGRYFHVDGSGRDTLRLSYAAVPPEVIDAGIARLANAFAECRGSELAG